MHTWNWPDIYKKRKGGLAIRRIADINEVAGIRLFHQIVLETMYIKHSMGKLDACQIS